MRDLFAIKEKTKTTGAKLEFLINQISEIKKEIVKINERQNNFEQVIDRKQEKECFEQEAKEEIRPKNNYDYKLENKKPMIITEIKEKKNTLELEAIKSVTKNKKTIIKQKILGIASKQRTTAKQIKEIIVNKYKYCSKATFYRYINELKKEYKLETISVNNKEYVCNIKGIQSNKKEF